MGAATGKSRLSTAATSISDHEAETFENGNPEQTQTRPLLVCNQPPSGDYHTYLARATNDAVRDWDVTNGKLLWPHGLESLFGYTTESNEITIRFWDECLHPGDYTKVTTSITDAFASGAEHWSGEYRFRCQDGRYLHVLERAFIVRDADSRPTRLVGSMMDVTGRKQLHDQLSRSQKMEAFGQLAGGVAHDFNNFLTSILGYSDLVLHETGRKGVVASHVAEIRKAAGRASALASQLLAFSRRHVLETHVVEVNSIILNLERTLLKLLGENITIVCQLHHEKAGAHVKVDAGQLAQIIINLAVNARDAMPSGGQLTLETAAATLSGDQVLCGTEYLPAGDYVIISVIDTGAGITEEVKHHLFEPFFTTKHHQRNSGLGLATSYGLVCQSGGRIRVESAVGRGTKVQIYLPKVPAPPAPSYRKPGSKLLPTGSECIMVVEDDVSVRHISVRVLKSLGYEVLEAASCVDAQRLFEKRGTDKIHLLVTDVVLPHMSGRDFAAWLRTVSPETKVVFVSGYLEESHNAGELGDAGAFFLSKPFDPEQLATAIRRALDS
jgi:two-component system, cell cycle sensor histidine kinase and response regulator CckA